MFALKINFKGKNILLGKGINSFEAIQKELQVRFPGELSHAIIVKYQGEVLEDFEQVRLIAESQSSRSLKLEVEAVSSSAREEIPNPIN